MAMAIEPLSSFGILSPIDKTFLAPISLPLSKVELCKIHNPICLNKIYIPQSFVHSQNDQAWRAPHTAFCHAKSVHTHLCDKSPNLKFADTEELSLLSKPSSIPVTDMVGESTKPDMGEAFEPFLKIFRSNELEEEQVKDDSVDCQTVSEKTYAEYYEPKLGDSVVGVVVSGNENKLDVNVGAELLGIMLTKEVLPLYDKPMDNLPCDLDKNGDEVMKHGKMGIIQNHSSICGKPASGRPTVDVGNVLLAKVLGITLSGRPLLSSRDYFRRIAWDRVRQIEQLGEPIQVRITEWNTFGLLARIEGLRAFLPKTELTWQVNSFTDLKDKVGSMMYVMINRINEAENAFVLSERDVWKKWYLREGSLLDGTIMKILPFGAVVRLGQTNKTGQLHVSNISLGKFNEVSDVLEVGEKVKVLVIKCAYPNKPSLSIADLESEPGLFISNKEKVFKEAEEMARRYRQKHQTIFTNRKFEPSLTIHTEDAIFANWEWFVFQSDDKL